jgi:S1-C subfamily serine protease
MKKNFCFPIVVLVLGGLPLPGAAAEVASSVIKVTASVRYPNPLKPWTKGDPVEIVGTGVIIEGNRILTNSHLVLYAAEINVQGRPGDDKVEAKVAGTATDLDLALLTLKDDDFFKKRPALVRSPKMPKIQDNVVVYGFPVGGSDLSVTKGVVSRINQSVIQISAAVNPGNSGGPAVVDDKMIGLVFGQLSGAENIGYIIPNEDVEYFLQHTKDGRYEGKPVEAAGTDFQRLDNDALRRMLKIDKSTRGLLIHPPPRHAADYAFKEFDVLMKIGDHEIDNDGMVRLDNDLRVSFTSLLPKLARDDAVPVTILRGGKSIPLALSVTRRDNRLVREFQGEPPSYFIHGPLVFSPVRGEAITYYARLNPAAYDSNSPMINRRYDRVQFPGEELVVITSPMFKHKVAKGYAEPVGKTVKSVNGVVIKNLRHLVETLRDCTDDFLVFRFFDEGSEVLVFDRKEMENATEEILEENGIAPARRGSADIMKNWKK